MTADKVEILKKTLLFSDLGDAELSRLAGLATERSFTQGEFIFWEGDLSDWLYMIAEGQVKVFKMSPSGKEFIIAFFNAGDTFGEVAVFGNRPFPASAQAVSETRLLAIKRADFADYLANSPEVAMRMLNILGERLRNAQNRLKDFAGARVEQRIAGILLMLSAKLGLTLPFTRQEIADMSGTTTETAIRIMSQLKERGIIRSTRGKIIIANKEKLRLLSEGPPNIV